LWHGDLDEAETHIQASLTLTERTGDVVLQSRCLTYLTVLCRKRGDVQAARGYIERSLAAATAAKMLEYIGMAKANLAWVAWRDGNLAEAQAQGQAALEVFQQVPQGGIFLWVALWPLIGVALAQGQATQALEHARRLLPPPQMRLPEALEQAVQQAIDTWEGGKHKKARACLKQATHLAETIGYL
jgi:tetratricopeptide (TPR) repeat protein